MFWVIIFSIVFILSFLLALRSMRGYAANPKPVSIPQSLFLIRNVGHLTSEILDRIHHLLLEQGASLSLETLLKGNEQAVAIYLPTAIVNKLPELDLLELEDYLIPADESSTENKSVSKINADQSFGWQVPIKPGMGSPGLLTGLNLKDEEQFFWQLVCMPLEAKKGEQKEMGAVFEYQLTLRAMVSTKQRLDKVSLAKRLFQELNTRLGLNTDQLHTSSKFFDKYRFRLSEEGSKERFSASQILKLLGV